MDDVANCFFVPTLICLYLLVNGLLNDVGGGVAFAYKADSKK